jgi:citrate synthase
VKIGSQDHRHTAISASNAEQILVRGKDLCTELIGRIGFTDYIWLLLTGSQPSEAQRRVLDATLVAIAEHGLVPSVVAGRMTFAAEPASLQGAVAAGLLGCGSVILGASEAAGRLFNEVLEAAAGAAPDAAAGSTRDAVAGTTPDAAAATVLRQYRAARRPIPGYGHPLHKDHDPRARRLFEVAAETGVAGRYVATARTIERLLPGITGKPLAMNVSGAIPAVLLDAGYPAGALRGVPILARTASLVAHLLEEQLRPIGFVLSHAAAAAVGYDGPAPAGFVAGDE